jgi:hypothetical protein
MTAETTPSQEALNTTSYKFIFCEHLAESVPAILEQLESCDAVAIELEDVPDQETRDNLDSFFTMIASADPEADILEAMDEMMSEDDADNDPNSLFFKAMLKGLAGSDKPVITLGNNLDEPNELRDEARTNETVWNAHRYVNATHDRTRGALSDYLIAFGREMPGQKL